MKNKYIVALATGGLMECPVMYFEDFQVIDAENEKQAQEIYNEKNKCNFFYGLCLGEVNEKTKWLIGRKRPIKREIVLNKLGEL